MKEKLQKILGLVRKICEQYNLIADGDKIAIGVSGGKDSLLLLTALSEYRKFASQKFDIVPIAIDLSNGKNDYTQIQSYCKTLGLELDLVLSPVFEVVFDIRKEKNPCSLCANMRRGILNTRAKELGCNKVALGHHKDDLVETFIMSLFFEGRFSTFKPKTYLSRMDLHVIRPLLFVDEELIKKISINYSILINNCPANKHTEREKAKIMIKNMENDYENAKEKIFNAIIHTERYNLYDKID